MTDTPDRNRPRLELSGVQVVGGALAATTSAVAASALGVGGTLAGAALGSVLGTVGGALYTYSLQRTTAGVRTVVLGVPGDTGPVVDTVPVVQAVPVVHPPAAAALPAVGRGRRWAPLGAAVAAFALAMGGVSAAELVTGQPVSSAVYAEPSASGTTIGAVVGNEPTSAADGAGAVDPTPAATPSAVPTTSTSGEATEGTTAGDEPVPAASATPGPVAPAPTDTPSAEPGIGGGDRAEDLGAGGTAAPGAAPAP